MTRLPGDRARLEWLYDHTGYGRYAAPIPDWDEMAEYAPFDIVRGPDGGLYAATYERRLGPPPGDGWTPWLRATGAATSAR